MRTPRLLDYIGRYLTQSMFFLSKHCSTVSFGFVTTVICEPFDKCTKAIFLFFMSFFLSLCRNDLTKIKK